MDAHDQACYHCGLPIPVAVDLTVDVDQQPRRMCCAGCQAVAQAIVGNGLTDYYRHRDALPERPREAMPAELQEAGLFDLPEMQKSFVHDVTGADGQPRPYEREAALMLEGITCAACIWLNEAHLSRQPGVTAVDINYATRRARVRWDARQIKLSQILTAITAIGYRAHPYDPALSEQIAQKERRAALWRLFVAGFGMGVAGAAEVRGGGAPVGLLRHAGLDDGLRGELDQGDQRDQQRREAPAGVSGRGLFHGGGGL